jgi:hypothetical protein
MAPVSADLFEGVVVFEELGITTRVVVIGLPAEFVVVMAVERVDETLLVEVEREVLDVAVVVVVLLVEVVEEVLLDELLDEDWLEADEEDEDDEDDEGLVTGVGVVLADVSVPLAVPIDAKPKAQKADIITQITQK